VNPFLLTLSILLCVTAGVPARAEVSGAHAYMKVDKLLVHKSERRLYLVRDDAVVATYEIALGRNPVGPKIFRGDGRTPEGEYRIAARNTASRFYRSLRISYPSSDDWARASEYGISPGGDIMIHGQPNDRRPRDRKDWTEGCIALSNSAMDQVWDLVELGTPIEIKP
jgi:murein L,D-transpeptidase YafK